MPAQSSMHMYVNWAKERLDEMDATLALFEKKVAEVRADARAKADSALADMRTKRDAFRDVLKTESKASEAEWTRAKAALESDWSAFEAAVQKYVDAAGKQLEQQEAAFRARATAQAKAWRGAMDQLHGSMADFAADRRADVDSALKRMKVEADAAQAKLDKLSGAGTEAWSAMIAALAETRAAFDRANQAASDAFKRAARG